MFNAVKLQYAAITHCLKDMEEEGEKRQVVRGGKWIVSPHDKSIILEKVPRVVHVTIFSKTSAY